MRVCGGGCARGGHYSGRGLLVRVLQPQAASDPQLDAQRAQLERAMAVATTVLFVFTVSYVVLSAIYGCFCTGASRQQPGGGGETWPPQRPTAAAAEETKRALQEIPVVVVQVTRDPGSGRACASAVEEPGECAVCLAEYEGGEEVRVLPACRHGFHRECVDRWLLTRAPTCPVCRARVAAHAEGPDAKV